MWSKNGNDLKEKGKKKKGSKTVAQSPHTKEHRI